MTSLLCTASQGGEGEMEQLVTSPRDPVVGFVEYFKAAPGVSDWAFGNLSLWRGRSNTGAGFLKWWCMCQACQCLHMPENI